MTLDPSAPRPALSLARTGREALTELTAELAALDKGQLVRPNIDVLGAAICGYRAAAALETFRPELARQLTV